MGLVICIGGVLLLMLLVCGEEINTFGPLLSIVSRCIALHCIERAGAAIMVTHTVCLSLQYWSLTRDVCSLMHVCDLCLFYCVCVCLVWIALWSQCIVTILKHTWHDTNNTHLLPCVLCAQYCTSLKVAILSRNAHYRPTSTSSTLATLSGTLGNAHNPNLPAYATLWPRFFVLDGWTAAPRLVVINRDLPSPTYLIRPVMNISAWNDCLPVNYTSWLTYFFRPSSQIMQLHNSFDRFRCLLSLEISIAPFHHYQPLPHPAWHRCIIA